MVLYTCPKCGDTYFLDDVDEGLCNKCKVKLVAMCEWCGKPEKECHCGKDEIKVEQME